MGNNAVDTHFFPGLEGVMVGETAISNVEGAIGRLSYRGYDITTLADKPFAAVAWLVLFGDLPTAGQAAELEKFLQLHSALGDAEHALLRALPTGLHPMLMLQALVPTLNTAPMPQAVLSANVPEQVITDTRPGLVIASKIPSLLAAWHRLELGLAPVPPDDSLSFHANFLWQFHGSQPSAKEVATLDAAQILQMEHSFNAGTFAGRVCASTEGPVQSVIAASIGTLYGRLHGGADQAALEMAMAIGDPAKAAAYVQALLADKQKIMGMGHREYKTVDPRAKLLKPMAVELCTEGKAKTLLDTLIAIEQACQQEFAPQGKEIWANVEFYKGAVFHALGVPTHFFTGLFAMARVFGYVAHFAEFKQAPRLIRPQARYIGR